MFTQFLTNVKIFLYFLRYYCKNVYIMLDKVSFGRGWRVRRGFIITLCVYCQYDMGTYLYGYIAENIVRRHSMFVISSMVSII